MFEKIMKNSKIKGKKRKRQIIFIQIPLSPLTFDDTIDSHFFRVSNSMEMTSPGRICGTVSIYRPRMSFIMIHSKQMGQRTHRPFSVQIWFG